MSNGSIITNSGRKIILNRSYKSSPDYTVVSKFKCGISNSTPSIGDTDLTIAVPITDGTVIEEGDTNMTGGTPSYDSVADGGSNSTNNTSTYKEGAGETDATAQNLITDTLGTGAQKSWLLNPLTANFVAGQPFGFWLYIKDTTAYAKFKSSGTALQLRIRTNGDGTTLYYYYNRTKAQLAVGWNWVTSNTVNVNALSTGAGGAPSGVLNEFVILITTENASDEFVAGDVVYDLMRTWATTDLVKDFVSGYPTFDETNMETQYRCLLSTVNANGFNINSIGIVNTDGTVLMHSIDVFTVESKSSTDQFTFIIKDRIE